MQYHTLVLFRDGGAVTAIHKEVTENAECHTGLIERLAWIEKEEKLDINVLTWREI